MIKCPFCENYEFTEDNDFDICEVCGWENDGVIMTEKDKEEKESYYKAHTAPDGNWIP